MLFLMFTSTMSASKTSPITINAQLSNFDSIPSISQQIKIYVGTCNDLTSSSETGIIGKTRTGIKTYAPIVVKPLLSESIRSSLEELLRKKGNLTTDASIARYIMSIKISECTLTEKSVYLTQTMDVKVKMDVELADPLDSTNVRRFSVESQNSSKTLDTTKEAENILKGAIEYAFREIFKTISKY